MVSAIDVAVAAEVVRVRMMTEKGIHPTGQTEEHRITEPEIVSVVELVAVTPVRIVAVVVPTADRTESPLVMTVGMGMRTEEPCDIRIQRRRRRHVVHAV